MEMEVNGKVCFGRFLGATVCVVGFIVTRVQHRDSGCRTCFVTHL
jgi:hypothetical protein